MIKIPRVKKRNFLLDTLKKNVWRVEDTKDKKDIKRLQIGEEELILDIVISKVEIFILFLILASKIDKNISQ